MLNYTDKTLQSSTSWRSKAVSIGLPLELWDRVCSVMMGQFPTNMHIFVTCDDNDCTMHNVQLDTQAVNGKKITITQPSCRLPDCVCVLAIWHLQKKMNCGYQQIKKRGLGGDLIFNSGWRGWGKGKTANLWMGGAWGMKKEINQWYHLFGSLAKHQPQRSLVLMDLWASWQTKFTQKNHSSADQDHHLKFQVFFLFTHVCTLNSPLLLTVLAFIHNSTGVITKFDIKFILDADKRVVCSRRLLKWCLCGRTSACCLIKGWKKRRWWSTNKPKSWMQWDWRWVAVKISAYCK